MSSEISYYVEILNNEGPIKALSYAFSVNFNAARAVLHEEGTATFEELDFSELPIELTYKDAEFVILKLPDLVKELRERELTSKASDALDVIAAIFYLFQALEQEPEWEETDSLGISQHFAKGVLLGGALFSSAAKMGNHDQLLAQAEYFKAEQKERDRQRIAKKVESQTEWEVPAVEIAIKLRQAKPSIPNSLMADIIKKRLNLKLSTDHISRQIPRWVIENGVPAKRPRK